MAYRDDLAIALLDAIGIDYKRVYAVDLRFEAGHVPTVKVEYSPAVGVELIDADSSAIKAAIKRYELRPIEDKQEGNDA